MEVDGNSRTTLRPHDPHTYAHDPIFADPVCHCGWFKDTSAHTDRSTISAELDHKYLTGAGHILYERIRVIEEEGYSKEGDRGRAYDLMSAARAYLSVAEYSRTVKPPEYPPMSWPSDWRDGTWKPTGDAKKDLIKAGQLIAAAIDALSLEE